MSEAVPLRIPKLSMALDEVTFIRWLVEDGTVVKEGDLIYTIDTDKIVVDIEAAASGVLVQRASEGEVYKVGMEVGEIRPEG